MLNVTKKVLQILDVKQKNKMLIIGMMMLIGGIMESLSVTLILPLMTAITDETGWNNTWYAKLICNIFKTNSHKEYMVILLGLLIAIFLAKNIYLLFEYYVQNTFVTRNRFRMQCQLLHKFMNKPYVYFLNASSGEIYRIIAGDTSSAFGCLTQMLTFYTELIICIVLGITIFLMSPSMAGSVIIILLIELVILAKVIKPIMVRLGNENRREQAFANKWILQAINGIKSIKVGAKEEFFEKKYASHSKRVVRVEGISLTINNSPKVFIEAVTIAGVLGMLLIAILNDFEVASMVPQLAAFCVAAVKLLPSANRLSVCMSQISYLEGGLNNVLAMFYETSKDNIRDSFLEKNDEEKRITFNKEIHFKDVTFAYNTEQEAILNGADFKIRAGESVGIVGTSGSGKTTTIDIILGLLEPQKGRVFVDGIDIKQDIVGWRRELAYIPQTIFLTDDTIRANVAFGLYQEDVSEEKVWKALEEAQMKAFVESLPLGLDTVVGEQGVRLSGGQRQRIGIARALYNDPKVIFLDEATAALDNETEAAIMESINHLKGKKTMVIIAHRLSTIANCDVVYRVDNGKVTKETVEI